MKIENPYLRFIVFVIMCFVVGWAFFFLMVLSGSGNSIIVASPVLIFFGWVVYKAIRWKKNKNKK